MQVYPKNIYLGFTLLEIALLVSSFLQECIYWCQYVFKSAHPCVTMSLKVYILVPLYVTVCYNNALYGTTWYFMVLYDTVYYCILGGVFIEALAFTNCMY